MWEHYKETFPRVQLMIAFITAVVFFGLLMWTTSHLRNMRDEYSVYHGVHAAVTHVVDGDTLEADASMLVMKPAAAPVEAAPPKEETPPSTPAARNTASPGSGGTNISGSTRVTDT